MLRLTTIACLIALATAPGCGKKSGDDSDKKTVEQNTPAPSPAAPTCDKGQVIDNGKCVTALTPQKIAAVKQQADKLGEIDSLLDGVEAVAGPIELINAFRQLDAWKTLAAKNDKLQQVEQVVATLDTAVKQLRALRTAVAQSRDKLNDLSATLDKAYQDSGAAGTLADLRAQTSKAIKEAIAPLETEVGAAVQNAIQPSLAELAKVGDLLDAACAIGKLSGGGDQMKEMCKQSEQVIGKAVEYLKGLEGKPLTLFTDMVDQLDKEVGDLVTAEVKQWLDQADARVKAAVGGAAAGNPGP